MKLALIVYNTLIIPPLRVAVFILCFFNSKLKEREKARISSLKTLSLLPDKKSTRVWFHAASMGEFEQAKPIIEQLKSSRPDTLIIVSFFSPSGYRNQLNYPYADAVVYMPLDTRSNAREFIHVINPDVAVFIRYELWLNHLSELSVRQTPTFLMCATFPRSNVWYFPIFKTILTTILSYFTRIFAVSDLETEHYNRFSKNLVVQTSSDTRFDRIISVVERAETLPKILPHNYFSATDFVLVIGSSWEKDEDIILEALKTISINFPQIKLVIVPHEPTEHHIFQLRTKVPSANILSQLTDQSTQGQHIIIDSIGKLLQLYSIASAAFVGGGFGTGVHSTSEPAGYGIPISCGTFIERSPDAKNLYKSGALEVIHSSLEFTHWIEVLLNDTFEYKRRCKLSKNYVYQGKGASINLSNTIISSLTNSKKTI